MLVQSDRRRQNLVDALVSALDQKGRVERLSLFLFQVNLCHSSSSVLIPDVDEQFLSERNTAKHTKSEARSKTSWLQKDASRGG